MAVRSATGRPRRPALRAAAVAAAVAVAGPGAAVTACGSHPHYSGVAPKKWGQTVCEAWNAWQQDTASRLAAFRTKTATLTLAADQRDQLVGLFDALGQTSAQMVTTVRDAGHPAVKEGPAAEDAYVSTLAAFQTTYSDAKTRAAGLPLDDNAKYTQDVQAISAMLDSALKQITARISQIGRTYRDPKLTSALGQPACRSLSLPAATTTTTTPGP